MDRHHLASRTCCPSQKATENLNDVALNKQNVKIHLQAKKKSFNSDFFTINCKGYIMSINPVGVHPASKKECIIQSV